MPQKKVKTITQNTSPISLTRFIVPAVALLVAIIITDAVYHYRSESLSLSDAGFYSWFSIISCVLILGAAHLLRISVKRTEKYYRREAESK